MEKLIILIASFIPIYFFSQNLDDEKIYTLIIENYTEKKIVIEDSTSIDFLELSELNYNDLKSRFSILKEETLDNFIENNKISNNIVKSFPTQKKIMFIGKKDIKSIFKTRNGWEEFYKKYSKPQGILTLSNIGYDNDKTQALAYFGNQSHWRAGKGYLAVFEKINGVWKINHSYMIWIS